MDTPLREQIDIELSEHSVSATDLQLFRECIERMIDQEATKRVVEALEGVLESVAKYKHWSREQYLSAMDKEQTMLAYDMDSRTIAAQQIETKIDAAIKQAKGAHNE